MNIFLIHHRSPHHANTSGYGRLLEYLDAKVIYGTTKFPFRMAKVIAGFHSQTMGNYNVGSFLKALELYRLLKQHKGQHSMVHFLNGERDVRHINFFKKRFPDTRFIATFHKPPEVLKKTITNVAALQKLDGAIAVGANQVKFLKEWLQLESVCYIPHGVDTQFFYPDLSVKKKNTLLFVGQHLRDFDTFNTTIPKLAATLPKLKMKVVIHPGYVHKIDTHKQLEVLTNVDDETLRTLYQEASVLYLPMLDSTACNSILEAMACGLPIITSDVGGNMMYLENTSNIVIKKENVELFIVETAALLKNEYRRVDIGETSRKKALELNWSIIANDIKNFYKKLD